MLSKIEAISKKLYDLKVLYKNEGIREIISTRTDHYLNNSLLNKDNSEVLDYNYKELSELLEVSNRQLNIQNLYEDSDGLHNN